MFEKEFEGKVVIITGGSRGLGFAGVKAFLASGAKVCFLSSNEKTGEKALAELKSINPNYEVINRVIDLCSDTEAKALYAEVVELWGRIDVLVNNAGIDCALPLTRLEPDNWDKVMTLNTKSVYNMCRFAITPLKATEGCIINIASVAGVYYSPSGLPYPASKAAVISMTKSIAFALAPVGIRCNSISPGVMETDIVAALPQFAKDSIGDSIPLRLSTHPMMGQPEDVAYAMLFLASRGAQYITATNLQVDAGYIPSNHHKFVDFEEFEPSN